MAKIYLAAQYRQKHDVQKHAEKLRDKGHEITSSWLEEEWHPSTTMDMVPVEELIEYAKVDLQDIRRADIFVLFTVSPLEPTVRGGRHCECGYALALDKPIYIVGPRENVFLMLPHVVQVDSIERLAECINKNDE